MPPLGGAAGCFRVSGIEEGGNIRMCGGRTGQTFAVCRLYNPYLLVAGSAPWNRALPTMLMAPSRGGDTNALIAHRPILMYMITACVFRDGDSAYT